MRSWERSNLRDGGERLNLVVNDTVLGTVVRLPGTVTRVYWPAGNHQDVPSVEDGVRLVEELTGVTPGRTA